MNDHAQAISFPRVFKKVVGRGGGCTRGEPDSMCQYKPQIERKSPGLHVKRWVCCDCGESHERDVNAAKNILRRAELPASIRGNEPLILRVLPSRAPPRSRKAGTETARSMASHRVSRERPCAFIKGIETMETDDESVF